MKAALGVVILGAAIAAAMPMHSMAQTKEQAAAELRRLSGTPLKDMADLERRRKLLAIVMPNDRVPGYPCNTYSDQPFTNLGDREKSLKLLYFAHTCIVKAAETRDSEWSGRAHTYTEKALPLIPDDKKAAVERIARDLLRHRRDTAKLTQVKQRLVEIINALQ